MLLCPSLMSQWFRRNVLEILLTLVFYYVQNKPIVIQEHNESIVLCRLAIYSLIRKAISETLCERAHRDAIAIGGQEP